MEMAVATAAYGMWLLTQKAPFALGAFLCVYNLLLLDFFEKLANFSIQHHVLFKYIGSSFWRFLHVNTLGEVLTTLVQRSNYFLCHISINYLISR